MPPIANHIPRADQSEQAIIGCLLLRGSPEEHAFDEIPTLQSSDFFLPECRLLFQACLDLFHAGSAIDQILVAYHLQTQNKLDALGNIGYIIHCLDQVETSYHLKYYAEIVQDAARRREMLNQAGNLARAAFEPVPPPSPPQRGPVKGL